MIKLNFLLLNDYLKEPSDLRLSLFCRAINTDFNLTSKAKNQLKLLIEDYKKSPENKQRLKVIEQFIGNNSIKTTKLKKNTNNIMEKMPFPVSTRLSNNLADENMGKESQDSTEKAFIIGILGDWTVPGTFAYEIINGTSPVIRINGGPKRHVSAWNMDKVLIWLQKHSGNQIKRQFNVISTIEEGSNSPGWVLVEVGSAASYNPKQTVYIKDGKSTIKEGWNI